VAMNWNDYLQTFREENGLIICIKYGFIAVDIPIHKEVKKAEVVGVSSQGDISYYDIALDGKVSLHIFRMAWHNVMASEIKPYYFEDYPF